MDMGADIARSRWIRSHLWCPYPMQAGSRRALSVRMVIALPRRLIAQRQMKTQIVVRIVVVQVLSSRVYHLPERRYNLQVEPSLRMSCVHVALQ